MNIEQLKELYKENSEACRDKNTKLISKQKCAMSKHKDLSEKFIKENHKDLCWICLSEHQDLSEKFIEEWKDYIPWVVVSICQKLSKKFLIKYKKNMDTYHILRNKKISNEIKLSLMKKYKMIEKENPKKHFIEYSKVINKVKDFKNLIENI